MSRINGEKARAAIAKKRRTAQREKDRVMLAKLRSEPPAPKPAKKKRVKKAAPEVAPEAAPVEKKAKAKPAKPAKG